MMAQYRRRDGSLQLDSLLCTLDIGTTVSAAFCSVIDAVLRSCMPRGSLLERWRRPAHFLALGDITVAGREPR